MTWLSGVDSDAGATGGLLGNREPIVIGASNANNNDDSGDLAAIRTSNGFKGIIDGEYDSLPEQAFYMVGTIEEAVEKGKSMQ